MGQLLGTIVVLASLYALLAAGYVVVYRSSRVLNFSHGEFMMLGGYFTFIIASFSQTGALTGIIGGLALCGLIGLFVYYAVMRQMLGQPVFSTIVVTIGLSIMFRGLATLIWGSDFRYLTRAFDITNAPHLFSIFGMNLSLSTIDLVTIVTSIICIGGLLLFYRFTNVGIQMRAAAESSLLASQRGINFYASFLIAWMISLVLATTG